MDVRGIPTAAYQVLHLLSCTGGGGTAARGYPTSGTPPVRPGWQAPHSCWGYPTSGTLPSDLAGGYPIPAGGYPTSGTPWLDLAGVPSHWTWLGHPTPPSGLARVPLPIIPGWGTPSSLGVDRLKTLPFPILRMQSVKKIFLVFW